MAWAFLFVVRGVAAHGDGKNQPTSFSFIHFVMSPFQLQSEFYNLPVRLSEEQRENPASVLNDFFADYNLSEVREILNTNAEVCLTSDIHPYDAGERRADFIHFQQKLELLLEAAFLIAKQ
jgi:hypothetical protein